MDILKIPNKILTTPDEELTDFSEVRYIFESMAGLAIDHNLIGLSGNQVGLLRRVFVMNASITETPDWQIFINPKTKVNKELGKCLDWEGSGSIPNVSALVERWKGITLTYTNLQGEKCTGVFAGLLARVIQHEIDHLNGVLITSKARQLKRLS